MFVSYTEVCMLRESSSCSFIIRNYGHVFIAHTHTLAYLGTHTHTNTFTFHTLLFVCEVRRECVECELLNAHTPHEQQSAAKRQATTGAAADADAAAASSLQLIDNSDVMRRVAVMRLHGKLPAIRQRATRTQSNSKLGR